MKKICKLIAMLTAIVVLACSFTGCIINTNPAVRVNETDLTRDEYGYYMFGQLSQTVQEAGVDINNIDAVKAYLDEETDGKKNIEIIREKAAEEGAKFLVQYNKAIEAGVTLTEEDKATIEADIASIKEQTGGQQAYEAQLASIGTTPAGYEALYEKNNVIAKYRTQLEEEGTLAVSDAEIETYIKENYIKAAHILFLTQDPQSGTPFDEATVSQKRTLAEETLTRVNNGEDFMTLMNELSEDTGLATHPDGYEFTKGQMVPQFEETAFALEENQVSGIVETSYGFHIIKKLPFEITPEKIEEYKEDAKAACVTDKFDALTEEWKASSEIKVFKSVTKDFGIK